MKNNVMVMPVVQLSKRLRAVTLVSGTAAAAARQRQAEQTASLQETQAQKQLYRDACAALQQAAARLNQLCDEMVAGHNEAIARLSVEIARKVLMRNITDGDYRIEAIIKEALQSVPESAGATVRLNPRDLADVQALQAAGDPSLAGIKLIADPDIGRAECVVESPRGMIKLLIDEHLEQISQALGKTG